MNSGPQKWSEVRKICFIKNNISRNIEMASGYIETFEALMYITIAKKNTLNRSVLKFVQVIWAQIWPASTLKHLEARVVWCST
jgi:hypothetical protein